MLECARYVKRMKNLALKKWSPQVFATNAQLKELCAMVAVKLDQNLVSGNNLNILKRFWLALFILHAWAQIKPISIL
jgi:hypothetical protein